MNPKKLCLTVVGSLLLLCGHAFAQTKHPEYININEDANPYHSNDYDCVVKYHLTAAERKTIFPYSKAMKVLLVSFASKMRKDFFNGDTILTRSHVPVENDTLCRSQMKEIKTLKGPAMDALSDLLISNGTRGSEGTFFYLSCADCENGLVFLDEKNKVIAVVELCFKHNLVTELKGGETDYHFQQYIGEWCTQKVDILRSYFKKAGMKYVGEKEVD